MPRTGPPTPANTVRHTRRVLVSYSVTVEATHINTMPVPELLTALRKAPPERRAGFVAHLLFDQAPDMDASQLPEDLQADLDVFVEKAGLLEEDDAAAVRSKMNAYFKAHPLDPGLLAMFSEVVRETAEAEAGEAGRAARALLSQQTSSLPVTAAPRAPGAMGGGTQGLLALRTGRVTVQNPAPPAAPVENFKPNRPATANR
jgi:hypothetical protein